ncbi:hypothetical protein PUN28_005777 [Cardiocondyla obscurior]|uniref:Uncharacterized protein n=1 Tax=Cardiocondyla obscurior TaxID=286306 RepID=A0AAW2GAH2_9HYME
MSRNFLPIRETAARGAPPWALFVIRAPIRDRARRWIRDSSGEIRSTTPPGSLITQHQRAASAVHDGARVKLPRHRASRLMGN